MGPETEAIYQKMHTVGTYRECKGTIVRVIIAAVLRQESKGVTLSICDDEATTRGRFLSTGQNRDALHRVETFAPSWNRAKVKKLAAIWDRWHLNGMRAGCEHQRLLGWTTKDHLSLPCWECGYHYGSAWLHETLPDDVISFIKEL